MQRLPSRVHDNIAHLRSLNQLLQSTVRDANLRVAVVDREFTNDVRRRHVERFTALTRIKEE